MAKHALRALFAIALGVGLVLAPATYHDMGTPVAGAYGTDGAYCATTYHDMRLCP